jgi:uracil-DNA glycosylase family protein
MDHEGAARWVPDDRDVETLATAARGCRGCELWEDATQVVFSRGPSSARLVLVGEQPGDQEDLAGAPFVGPAGRVLVDALDAAGIDKQQVYVTNAVKHFRHTLRGKRRIHEKPGVAHVEACHPWLEAELAVVAPRVVVCLGATAARAVLGRTVRIGEVRGVLTAATTPGAPDVLVTTHPSALLRLRDKGDWDVELGRFVADLRVAAAGAADG